MSALHMKNMLEPGVRYAITINPVKQERGRNDQNFILTYSQFWDKMVVCRGLFEELELYPEYSPSLRCDGKKKDFFPRLHFHGTFVMNEEQVFKFYTSWHERLLRVGMFCIKLLDDAEGWEAYCTQNRTVMQSFCKRYTIPYRFDWSVYKKKKLRKRMVGWATSANRKICRHIIDSDDDSLDEL